MLKKKLLFFLVTLSLLGLYFLTSSTGDPTSTSGDPPDDPWLNPGNGEKINITAGNRTQIRTTSGNMIQLCTNESVKLQINESNTNPAGSLPNQTRAVNRYMHIELNGTVEMNATLSRNYTNNELSSLGNVSTFRWAYYSESTFQWEYAHQNWVEITPDGASVCCNTDHFSIWTILASTDVEMPEQNPNPTPGEPFECQNGTGFAVQAGNMYQIKTQSGFSLQLKLNQSSEVTVTEYEESPKPMTRARHQIQTKTFAIELNNSAQIQANFSYKIANKNQLGIKNMEKLKFMFYNESSKDWEAPKHQWLESDTLYCNTTHFSFWTIAEDESTDASTPGFTILPLTFVLIVLLGFRKKK